MIHRSIIENLKLEALNKGKEVQFPENGNEILVIKEEFIKDQYSVSVGVGKAIVINYRYFDVKGKIISDSFPNFSDNVLRIEPKLIKNTKGTKYFAVVFKPGFVLAIDEATWKDKFATLQDLIEVLKNLGNSSLQSLFDEIKTIG
ncbi:hypothetical protein [Candidatus Harpocratesius sp.]